MLVEKKTNLQRYVKEGFIPALCGSNCKSLHDGNLLQWCKNKTLLNYSRNQFGYQVISPDRIVGNKHDLHTNLDNRNLDHRQVLLTIQRHTIQLHPKVSKSTKRDSESNEDGFEKIVPIFEREKRWKHLCMSSSQPCNETNDQHMSYLYYRLTKNVRTRNSASENETDQNDQEPRPQFQRKKIRRIISDSRVVFSDKFYLGV